MAVLRKLADAYAVPLSSFYGEATSDLKPALPDFRTLKNQPIQYTADLVKGIAWADDIAQFTKYLSSNLRRTTDALPSLKSPDTASAARELEGILNFGANFRSAHLTSIQLIKYFRKELGDLGVIVLQDSINDPLCKGFCFNDPDRAPAIVINTRNQGSYEARLFTLLHEACHIFMGREGIVDPFSPENEFERTCNAITAEFLAPTSEFLRYVERQSIGSTPANAEVRRIASHFRLSQQAAALRLETVGVAQKGFYNSWIKQFEGQPFPDQSGGGGGKRPDEGVIKLAKYGHHFIFLCAEAINKKLISELDVFRVAGLKPQYFPQTVEAAAAFVKEVEGYAHR